MTLAAVVDALELPPEARVDQRVPKRLLLEHGTPTVADKRRIQDSVDELRWIAALKPSNIGVPEHRDEIREYLEIAVLTMAVRPSGKLPRLTELVHRAIPYPVVLATSRGPELSLSLAHKRFSQGEAGAVVLDGAPLVAPLNDIATTGTDSALVLSGLALVAQPRADLFALYQGWIESAEAVLAARATGRFARADTPEAAAARRDALERYERLKHEIAELRARADKETQLNRRVEWNLTIQRLQAELARAADDL